MQMQIPLQAFSKAFSFFKRKRDLIGVDIGTHAIKLVCLKGSPGSWSLVKWAMIPYGEDIPLDTPLMDRRTQAVSALQNYLQNSDISIKKAATSVSGNAVIVRYVKMSKMPPGELSKSLKFEAEPYIPFNIEEVNLGFSILGDVIEEGQTQMETVLVAAKKDSVDVRVSMLRDAGLQPVIMDVDAFALESAYEAVFPPPQGETVLFMNVGATFANMSIVEKGISRVVRDVLIAGNTFTKAIQTQFQCDVKTAEQKKMAYGIHQDETAADAEAQQVVEVLLPVARDLLLEVQRSIDFYLSQGSDRTVSRIFLCGGSANLKGLDKFLGRELNIPVEIFNPLTLMSNAPDNLTDEERALLPYMAVAAGLATRREGDSPA
jgi:type IV pilus assembly protein PilM